MTVALSPDEGSACVARRRAAALTAFVLLTGCTRAVRDPRPQASQDHHWTGRLSLDVGDEPAQRFYAAFELRGTAERGQMTISGPLGNQLAELTWKPGRATVLAGKDFRESESLEGLAGLFELGPLPIRALFDWLAGRQTAANDWLVDLGRLDTGRLSARRTTPGARASLQLILDR
jgi:outer membrane lipoprotein LolB